MTERCPPLVFRASTPGSLGVEQEWITVEKKSGAQTPAAPALLAEIGKTPRIKPELFTSTIEINTDIHHETLTCMEELRALHHQVATELSKRNVALLASGTHPFSRWEEQEISDDPRYRRLVERLCWTARRFNIFGIHVHIGMPDGDTCIAAMNRLLAVMPVFLAISANSPYWCAHDTGLSSARIKVFEGLSQGGMPFYFNNWADFEYSVQRLMATGSIDSVRDIWWEMRPHPDFGTLEVRIGDMPATRADALAYIAYVRAEAMAAMNGGMDTPDRVHPSLIRENRWRACRYGMQAEMIDAKSERVAPVLDWLGERLEKLAACGADAADVAIVCRQLAQWRKYGDGATRQRRLKQQFPAWDEMLHAMRQDGWNDEV